MRRMRARARTTVLAAIGAAALVVPLLVAASPAEALIPKAELSIDKTVASHRPTIKLNAALSNTRENGHLAWVDDGLRLFTENDPNSCVSSSPPVVCTITAEYYYTQIAEYLDTSTPLSDVIAATGPYGPPSLEYQATTNLGYTPEYRLLVDFLGSDGVPDVTLSRPHNSADWTGYFGVGGGGFPPLFAVIPVPNTNPTTYTSTGTLAQWRTALSSQPQAQVPVVTAFGFAVPALPGSATIMDGTLKAINFAGTHHDLRRVYQSGLTAAPGEVVSYKLRIANGNSANAKAAQGVQVADVLPPDMTYVPGSLVTSATNTPGSWVNPSSWPCAFTTNMLTCGATTFAKGQTRYVRFDATLDDSISTAGLPQTEGHWVDVQHNDEASTLGIGQSKTITATCPADYMATDGGLLLDGAGSSADIVIESSRVSQVDGSAAWAVKATNLGDQAAPVTAEVTCLAVELGSSAGHTHLLDAVTMPMQLGTSAGDNAQESQLVDRSCPVGWTPYAPEFEVASGIVVVRESYAVDNTWYWYVKHSDGAASSYGISCLAPRTYAAGGHAAELVISTPDDTITVASETQTEGVMACPADSSAIVGGYGGYSNDVLALGMEPRGDRYMFRFYNADWTQARKADIQVTCIGSMTIDEPTYKDVINTAYVTTTTKDRDYSDNNSSATVGVTGDPVAGEPSGVTVNPLTATRTRANGKTTAITMTMQCTKAKPCNFTVKAYSGANLVASKTTSLVAQANKPVSVPTTGLGKNLAFGDNLVVKIKTTAGTTTYNVGIVS
ncbi:hypothetical protein [Nocardioides sp. SR21]|uniref:hypothetical protein n=1 Tax=Nocardioides sp. SR21 TaxID=2919501 RepID=UPI001FA9EC6D|nr:hypothetical protein [Nocardioides sp. SR21]